MIGYYIYLEGSQIPFGGHLGLQSPELSNTSGCLSFYYHMYGEGVGNMSVVMTKKMENVHGGRILWHKQGNQTNQWWHANVQVQEEGKFTV